MNNMQLEELEGAIQRYKGQKRQIEKVKYVIGLLIDQETKGASYYLRFNSSRSIDEDKAEIEMDRIAKVEILVLLSAIQKRRETNLAMIEEIIRCKREGEVM